MEHSQSNFEMIYQQNYQRVVRICLGYVGGDDDLAKDLTQEVFIKVWKQLGSFRNEASLPTWIYRITVNTCLLQLRKKKFSKRGDMLDNLTETENENHLNNENQLRQMYRCIDKLSKDNKGIILLELEGLPQKEIAEIMGLSHEAIRVRVHRIKNSLTKCVKK